MERTRRVTSRFRLRLLAPQYCQLQYWSSHTAIAWTTPRSKPVPFGAVWSPLSTVLPTLRLGGTGRKREGPEGGGRGELAVEVVLERL